MSEYKFLMNLQLFGEGGEGGDAGATGTNAGGALDADAAGLQGAAKAQVASTLEWAKKNGRAAGGMNDQAQKAQAQTKSKEAQQTATEAKAPDTEQAAQTEQHAQEARKTFDQVLEDPEYKTEMQKRIDKAISSRYAKAKAAEEQAGKLSPVVSALCAKYGLQPGDTDGLILAVNQDDSLIESVALEKGMSPEQYRAQMASEQKYREIERENAELKEAAQRVERQNAINSAYQQWKAQAAEAQKVFPSLNLEKEIKNKDFAQLLGNGIDVLTAYKVMHADEISQALVQNTAREVKKNTVDGIRSAQGRPRENAASNAQASVLQTDARNLKRNDYENIMARLRRGERLGP